MAAEKEMSFLEHLEELRWHIVRSTIAVLVVALVAFFFPKFILDQIVFAPANKDFITYRWLCSLGDWLGIDVLCIGDLPFQQFQSLQMGAQFTWHIWTSVITGIVVAFPYIVFEIWRFIKPALHAGERKYVTGVVVYISLLFILGILFGYYMLVPLTVSFLGNYDVSDYIQNVPVFTSYISTTLTVVLGCGLVFELPIFIYFLAKLGIVTPDFLKTYRKHAIIVILILAAIITPPDIASQILVSIPMLILYEISIVIAKRVYKA